MRVVTRYMYIKHAASYPKRKVGRIIALCLVGSGILLLLSVIFPIFSWQLFYAPQLSSGTVVVPIPNAVLVRSANIKTLLSNVKGATTGFDSTKASAWFPTGNPASGFTKEYELSVPKLGIKQAKVIVGADDLSKSLIHYGGSGLPGEYGNAVIFGHSVLPQFFNPNNYKAIFSTLHTLKKGDTIEIVADGVAYKYTIFDFQIVSPDDISVLEQTYDNSYLTVITCTPPGTYWKRLVIRAKIEKV